MNNNYVNALAEVIASIEDKRMAKEFLENILTPSELNEISMRLQIVKMLNVGISHRDVAKTLGVSIGTVSRGSRELKYGKKGFEKVLKYLA